MRRAGVSQSPQGIRRMANLEQPGAGVSRRGPRVKSVLRDAQKGWRLLSHEGSRSLRLRAINRDFYWRGRRIRVTIPVDIAHDAVTVGNRFVMGSK